MHHMTEVLAHTICNSAVFDNIRNEGAEQGLSSHFCRQFEAY